MIIMNLFVTGKNELFFCLLFFLKHILMICKNYWTGYSKKAHKNKKHKNHRTHTPKKKKIRCEELDNMHLDSLSQ